MILPHDLKDYRAHEVWWRAHRDKVVGVGCALLFAYYLLSPSAARDVHEPLAQAPATATHATAPGLFQHQGAAEAAILVESEYAAMRAQMYESVRMSYGRMKAACMAGDLRITWVDPYTKRDMAAACDVVALGRLL